MRKIAQILDSHFVKIADEKSGPDRKKSVDKSKTLWYNKARKKERETPVSAEGNAAEGPEGVSKKKKK